MTSEIYPLPAQESMGSVPVTQGKVGGVNCLVVNARELHSAIGNERKFADWAKYKIAKFGFKEGVDFEVLKVSPRNVKNPIGGRPAKEYILTLGPWG